MSDRTGVGQPGMQRTIAVAVGAVITGALSGYFLLPNVGIELEGASGSPFDGYGFLYGPGFFFGILLAGAALVYERVSPGKATAIFGLSILTWRLALEIATTGIGATVGEDGAAFGEIVSMFVVPGALGALGLAATQRMLVRRSPADGLLRAAIAGGVLGLMMYGIGEVTEGGTGTLIEMFVVWQLGVALLLDLEVKRAPEATPVTEPPAF